MSNFTVEWLDSGHEAQCPPNPAFPEGVDLIVDAEAPRHCVAMLTCPAPRCGVWEITCGTCRKIVIVTAAGRVDDPRAIAIACERTKGGLHG